MMAAMNGTVAASRQVSLIARPLLLGVRGFEFTVALPSRARQWRTAHDLAAVSLRIHAAVHAFDDLAARLIDRLVQAVQRCAKAFGHDSLVVEQRERAVDLEARPQQRLDHGVFDQAATDGGSPRLVGEFADAMLTAECLDHCRTTSFAQPHLSGAVEPSGSRTAWQECLSAGARAEARDSRTDTHILEAGGMSRQETLRIARAGSR